MADTPAGLSCKWSTATVTQHRLYKTCRTACAMLHAALKAWCIVKAHVYKGDSIVHMRVS